MEDYTERLDLRAKDYAQKIRERRQRRHQQRIAEELRTAITSVEAATCHFQEFLESGGGGDDSPLTRMYLNDARSDLENALGGIEERS